MKNIDLNKSKDLIALKEGLSKSLDKQIRITQLNEYFDSIDSLNIGTLKTLFESVIGNMSGKNSIKLLKEYVKTIKRNKSLKTAYQLYETVKNNPSSVDTSSILIILENSFDNIEAKSVVDGEKKLLNVLKENISDCEMSVETLEEVLNRDKEINEAIDFLIKNKRSPKTLFESSKSLKVISDFINENKVEEKQTLNNITQKEYIDNLNKILSESEYDWEKNAIYDISMTILADRSKEKLFEEYKTKCISAINEIECNESIEDMSKFSLMKEQITNKIFNEETFNDDIFKLSELNETLRNEI